MDHKNTLELLQKLHDEINSTQTVDDKGRELLRDIEGDIRALLERSEGNPVPLHPTLVQRLEGALDHFEITNPDLTMAISRLLESLSNVGI